MAAHQVCGHRRYERPWRSISRVIWLSEISMPPVDAAVPIQ
jgi:hypothetical protein